MEDLAGMVGRGFEAVDKKFAVVYQRFDVLENDLGAFKMQTTENFSQVEDNFKKVRNDILDIGDKFVHRHEFDNLLTRVGRIEQKVSGKGGK